jgi:hypothetical protein
MIFNDAIHVQVEKGKKDNNVEGVDNTKVVDCMCEMHDAWWCINPTLVMYE